MQKLDQSKVNNFVSQQYIQKQDLKDVVNYYLNEQEKKYYSIKPNDQDNETQKELALIDSRTWSFLQEILKGDDVSLFNNEFRNSILHSGKSSQQNKSDMEIESQTSLLSDSDNLDEYQKINLRCSESKEKTIFYYEFYQVWYNKLDNQRMQINGYDRQKMPNFLFDNQNILNSQYVSLEQSKGMIASKSYSDLEIIQDLVYYDNHLQRFAKIIKWLQNYCLTSDALDPQTIRSSQHNKINIENLGETQIDNQKLIQVYSLLKQAQGESAIRFMQNQNMAIPLALLDTIFPYHDYLLSDSNNPINLQSQLIQNELKNSFLVDIFNSIRNSEIVKERISHYKKNKFNIDENQLFEKQIGNQNWLQSLRSAFIASQEKKTEGETLYFSYLCANRSELQNYVRSENPWYEHLWLNMKYLYVHEVLKRFLVIKGLLYDSIEQFYPHYDNFFIDFSESPLENYRKLFHGIGIDQDIYKELKIYFNQLRNDKYEIQTQLILAYLKRDQYDEQQNLWENIFRQLLTISKRSYDGRDKFRNSSIICEFNAKLAFSLLNSQLFLKNDQMYNHYDHIIEYFAKFLISQDRQSEIIAFLKNLRDEHIIYGELARYMAQKQSELERKKIKQDMMMFGYSDKQIQGILKELVNNQFSSYNNEPASSASDQSVIDGLKMFIDSYQNNLYTCMLHFLSASRQFLESEKLSIYTQMRNDSSIKAMIERYKQYVNPQNENLEFLKDQDPFLNQLIAYDDLLHCYKLLDNLDNVKKAANTIKNQDIVRSSSKKNILNQMVQENENYKDFQIEKAEEFIGFCEKTFFKYNYKLRAHYIFIDVNVQFEQSELQEYNSHNIAAKIFKDLTSQYLLKCITKCLEVAQSFKVQDKIISFISKYYSPSYDAFTLFGSDQQESILKKSTNVLTSNSKFMKTVLNL